MTLTACGHSAKPEATGPAPDPIVETRTVREPYCPSEVTAPLPARVPAYAGPAIEAPAEYFAWIAAHFQREQSLEARIADARTVCP